MRYGSVKPSAGGALKRSPVRHPPDRRQVGLRSALRDRRASDHPRLDHPRRTFFDRQEARLIELSERDSDAAGSGEAELSEEYWAVSKRFPRVGMLASVLIVVAVFLKAAKP